MSEATYLGAKGEAHPRFEALRLLLSEYGLAEVLPEVAGDRGEIAALTAPAHRIAEVWPRIAELTGQIKALGFHYVALDLQGAEVLD